MQDAKVKVKPPRLASYQKAILESPARFTVTEASTKVGKTFSHIWWLFKQAHEDYIPQGGHVWWTAPVYGQAEIAFNRMRRKVATNPLYSVNLSRLTITTPRQTILEFKSAENPDNLYGEDVYAAVADEFTRMREEAWFALRSTLTATKGKCKFIGNVKGRGWGYNLAQKAKQGTGGEWEHFKITAYDAVAEGILSLEEIESAKRDLPENVFRELYLAEPSDDGGNPFGLAHIPLCVHALSREPAVAYGIDLAKSVDHTVCIGLDRMGRVCHFERWQTDWTTTKQKILGLPKATPVAIDSTGVGDPIVEELQRHFTRMEGYKFSLHTKQQLMEGLAVAIQNQEIRFPDGPIRNELEVFEYEYTRTGVRYSAPQGLHDDCVCALALAWYKFKDYRTRPVSMGVRSFGGT